MSEPGEWIDVGAAEDFKRAPLREAKLGERLVADLVQGRQVRRHLERLQSRRRAARARAGSTASSSSVPGTSTSSIAAPAKASRATRRTRCPATAVKEENGRLLVTAKPASKRGHLPHEPHPLTRSTGPRARCRCASAASRPPRWTRRTRASRRPSTCSSVALEHARTALGAETKLIKLNDLKFRNCEGYYSKAAKACTWPCSITAMDQDRPARPGVRDGGALGRRHAWSPRPSAGARPARSTTRWSSA